MYFPEDLCKTLQANPGYVLLDVRSQGEFDDTLGFFTRPEYRPYKRCIAHQHTGTPAEMERIIAV